MDRAGVEAWMERYRRAWIENDPDQVEALSHRNVTTRNRRDPVAVEYDGVSVLWFTGDRCRELRGWFFRQERQ